ncbi:branched-chain amino acid ABC transporter permease [bacterium]|nr:MAG: branched-chain amino acid ABC transporter permease [bacterium]
MVVNMLKVWLGRLGMAAVGLLILWAVQTYMLPRLNDYYQIILINAGIAIILAVSLNLINGITGQFSLGHAGFMAIGAYVAAYFTKEVGSQMVDPLNFTLGLLVGALAAGFAGLLVGLPSLRLRGDYLAIVTLGFNQIIVSIIRNLKVVGDASGYTNIPRFTNFAWTFGLVFLCILTVRNLATSNLGRSMRAVRDDEIAAEAAGINTTQIKVLAFVFSAMWAGVGGALQAHFIQYANPTDFSFLKSVEIVVSVVLGGLGSITGAALAAVGLKVLEEVMRSVPGVIWTCLGLIALSTYWSYAKHRAEISRGVSGIIAWLAGPVISLFIVAGAYFFAYGFLESSRSQLRNILYAIILIVLMLVRPQGLLGRAEWSLKRRGTRSDKAVMQA